eukprot:3200940-Alexandrium_andersonii.AAC.1
MCLRLLKRFAKDHAQSTPAHPAPPLPPLSVARSRRPLGLAISTAPGPEGWTHADVGSLPDFLLEWPARIFARL